LEDHAAEEKRRRQGGGVSKEGGGVMKKEVKTRGGRGGKKKKEQTAAVPSPAASIPVVDHEEQPTFEGIYERLHAAIDIKSGLNLSAKEAEFVWNRWLAIERAARELPSWFTRAENDTPAEIWEYISSTKVRGSDKAAIERNKKWVDLFSKRAWSYLQRLSGRFLTGPSGVEKEAAESIERIINTLMLQLGRATRMTSVHLEAGKNSAKTVYEKILNDCYRRVEANRKQAKRTLEYNKRGGKKDHTGFFRFQCGLWAREILFAHEDWLENPDNFKPTFGKFPIPMPKGAMGINLEDRPAWEDWFFRFFQHNIMICKFGGEEMHKQWPNQRTNLKKKLIPSYWEQASLWREQRAIFE
jgi:hypothetical protein